MSFYERMNAEEKKVVADEDLGEIGEGEGTNLPSYKGNFVEKKA